MGFSDCGCLCGMGILLVMIELVVKRFFFFIQKRFVGYGYKCGSVGTL